MSHIRRDITPYISLHCISWLAEGAAITTLPPQVDAIEITLFTPIIYVIAGYATLTPVSAMPLRFDATYAIIIH